MACARWNWLNEFRRRLSNPFSKSPPPSKFTRRRPLFERLGPVEALEQRIQPTATCVWIDDGMGVEGIAPDQMSFLIRLDGIATSPVTVSYAVTIESGDTASSTDFVAPFFTSLTIPVGESSAELIVSLLNDAEVEGSETFTVTLTGVVGVWAMADIVAVGTIIDNDAVWDGSGYGPGFSVDDPEVIEGDSGMTELVFTVTLTAASANTVTVDWATEPGLVPDGADPSNDYFDSSGGLSFAPGETEKTVSVTINSDTAAEGHETVGLDLSNPVNAGLIDPQGEGVILNDDGAWIWVDDFELAEEMSLAWGNGIPLTLDMEISSPITVGYYAWAVSATAGVDYELTPGTVTFEPGGASTQFIPISIIADGIIESNEKLIVYLAVIAGSAELHKPGQPSITAPSLTVTSTILDNDGFMISIDDVEVTEGDANVVQATFHITLATPPGGQPITTAVTVNYALVAAPEQDPWSEDGEFPASIPDDISMSPSTGTVTFAVGAENEFGVTTVTVTVVIQPDTEVEATEIAFVQISNPSQGNLTKENGKVRAKDNVGGNPPANAPNAPLVVPSVQPPGSGNFAWDPKTVVWHLGAEIIQPIELNRLSNDLQSALKSGTPITLHSSGSSVWGTPFSKWKLGAGPNAKIVTGPPNPVIDQRDQWKIRLDMIERQHKPYRYYENLNLGNLLDDMRSSVMSPAATMTFKLDPTLTANAEYYYKTNRLWLPVPIANVLDTTVFHETIHRIDDFPRCWANEEDKSTEHEETLGYLGEHLYKRLKYLQSFEQYLRNSPSINAATIETKWANTIIQFNDIQTETITYNAFGIQTRFVQEKYIQRFNTDVGELGLKVRFSSLKVLYQSIIDARYGSYTLSTSNVPKPGGGTVSVWKPLVDGDTLP